LSEKIAKLEETIKDLTEKLLLEEQKNIAAA
jgi:hypothetical protein